jgi:hypothetical protein
MPPVLHTQALALALADTVVMVAPQGLGFLPILLGFLEMVGVQALALMAPKLQRIQPINTQAAAAAAALDSLVRAAVGQSPVPQGGLAEMAAAAAPTEVVLAQV